MNNQDLTYINEKNRISGYNHSSSNELFNINLRPNHVLIAAMLITAIIVSIGLFCSYIVYELNNGESNLIMKLFILDQEGNVPTFFSYFLLNSCCFLLFTIYLRQKSLRSSWSTHWMFLAILFFILSFDEAAGIHEKLIPFTQVYLGATGWFHFGWIIPGGIFVIIIGITYIRFIMHLPKPISILSFVSGALYIGGALFVEMPEGAYAQLNGTNSFEFQMFTIVEEAFEMIGLSLYLYTLVTFLSYFKHENSNSRCK